MTLVLLLGSCSDSLAPRRSKTVRGEYIYRKSDESFLVIPPATPKARSLYPWEERETGNFPKITKEYFRCKGSALNPSCVIQKGKETDRVHDCGGAQKHSLPLKDQKEFVYPILIDLLNDIQSKTNKRVVITCGHCCPEHYAYIHASLPNPASPYSKHMIGAEVDFYVQGQEMCPEKIVELILSYYAEQPKYQGMKEFIEFKRYEKDQKSGQILPWMNKEIFVKIVRPGEGRDFDNRHPYPYICIQVRYDWDKKEAVIYSWDKAFRNFHRW